MVSCFLNKFESGFFSAKSKLFFAMVPALVALHSGPADARVLSNLVYFSPGCTDPRLDLYEPLGPSLGVTVIMFHGGGMVGGDKSDVADFCAELANRGCHVMNCNYTLAAPGRPSWPQSVRDAKNTVIWARGEGLAKYKLPQRIIVAGASAGGYLAMMVAATAGIPYFENLPHSPGAYRVDGFINMWGGSDLVWQVETYGQDATLMTYLGVRYMFGTEEIYRTASPITHLDIYDPPGFLFHGTRDETVPSGHSSRMYSRMAELGVPAKIKFRTGAGHGFDGWGGQSAMGAKVAEAVAWILSSSPKKPDFDGDGIVDRNDLWAYAAAYSLRSASCDINADSVVERSDFAGFADACAFWMRFSD